jgi:DNA-binding NarL/FixJ family response regulator
VKATPSGVIYSRAPLWIEALSGVLATIPVDVVGAAAAQDRCLEFVRGYQPDLLVIDAENATFEADLLFVDACRAISLETRVILLSYRSDHTAIQAALDAGVSAYTFKTASPDGVAEAVRKASEYSTYVATPRDLAPAPQSSSPPLSLEGLTRRELEILGLVANGYSNGRVAKLLWITEQTVKFHLSNIYRKLHVANRTEASRWAHARGLATTAPAQTELNPRG